MNDLRKQLLDTILPMVVFDGWSEASFRAAAEELGVSAEEARSACPKGAVDLACDYHQLGDAEMKKAVLGEDLTSMRFSERVAFAVRKRIEAISHKDAVRRGATLFALPQNAALGVGLVWGTADAIWDILGDTSRDGNWYSKRAILSGVYSSVIVFWLGDESEDNAATWDFLERRIADVMRIEELKSNLRANPFTKGLMAGVDGLMGAVKAPDMTPRTDLPGRWRP